ncbi:uncharacterized protein LOC124353782 [Homalodisca vitripennis]|uniref:uncharacterized protein LOC124353782 n=1 Tax=Homalodisca vitripennis TaxID=197043 RepID=UPI001EEAC0DC|nr:uncharacterized protein LOC124353782 [Homalodisca vitripennis]
MKKRREKIARTGKSLCASPSPPHLRPLRRSFESPLPLPACREGGLGFFPRSILPFAAVEGRAQLEEWRRLAALPRAKAGCQIGRGCGPTCFLERGRVPPRSVHMQTTRYSLYPALNITYPNPASRFPHRINITIPVVVCIFTPSLDCRGQLSCDLHLSGLLSLPTDAPPPPKRNVFPIHGAGRRSVSVADEERNAPPL